MAALFAPVCSEDKSKGCAKPTAVTTAGRYVYCIPKYIFSRLNVCSIMYVCIHEDMHECVSIYVFMHVCACMYACMHVCVCTFAYMFKCMA